MLKKGKDSPDDLNNFRTPVCREDNLKLFS